MAFSKRETEVDRKRETAREKKKWKQVRLREFYNPMRLGFPFVLSYGIFVHILLYFGIIIWCLFAHIIYEILFGTSVSYDFKGKPLPFVLKQVKINTATGISKDNRNIQKHWGLTWSRNKEQPPCARVSCCPYLYQWSHAISKSGLGSPGILAWGPKHEESCHQETEMCLTPWKHSTVWVLKEWPWTGFDICGRKAE